MSRFPPTEAGLGRMLEASGVPLPPAQLGQLWTYHQLLRERNHDGDLTRLHAFDTMVSLHYVDCLLVAKKLGPKLLAELQGPLLDIGSGAGFPGIPVKIGLPALAVVCCEMRVRRVAFMDEAIERCGLQGIRTWHQTLGQSFGDAVGGVITRAFEKIPLTLQRVRKMVPPGGLCVFMKGPHCDAEIAEARATLANMWQFESDQAYDIPMTTHHRRLVVFRRREDPREVTRRRSRPVEAASNPSFKVWQELLTGRGVRKHGLALVAGSKLVPEVLRDFGHLCVEMLVPQGTEHVPQEAEADLAVAVLAPALHQQLDVHGTRGPLVVVRGPAMPAWQGTPQGAVLAVPFQDPENVGAVLRSAAALGITEAILLREAASPFHPKALRAGGLAALRMTLWQGPSLQELASALPPEQLVALSAEGTALPAFKFPAAFVLLPGVEGPGLPVGLRVHSVAIAMAEGSESLNGATAAALAMYAWQVQTRTEGA